MVFFSDLLLFKSSLSFEFSFLLGETSFLLKLVLNFIGETGITTLEAALEESGDEK